MENTKKDILIQKAYFFIGIVLILLGTIIIIIGKYPQVWYALNINSSENEFLTLTKKLEEDFKEYERDMSVETFTLPPLDPTLPAENHLYIDNIGVNAKIHEGDNYEELLNKGVWMVNDFSNPEDGGLTILSSHRFGYFTWSQQHRNSQSFYNLPNTRVGDNVEIVWNQRRYIYEIYKVEEDTRITDYTADLILYTCKLYNSPERIFRYATRLE